MIPPNDISTPRVDLVARPTDWFINIATKPHIVLADFARELERENRDLRNDLDRACTAAGMRVNEEHRFGLLADKVRAMRDTITTYEATQDS